MVQHGNAGIDEATDGLADRHVQLGRMVGVDHQEGRQADRAQECHQLVSHALGNDNGQAGMDAQPPKMGDRLKPFEEHGQPLVGERQRIPAAEQDFLDRAVLRQQIERRLPVIHGPGGRLVVEVTSKAVPAMDGAGRGRYHQNPTRVFLK